jgi:putative ABC transport system permease protein
MAMRIFRALLRLFPEEFRSAYARDMEATFRTERREAVTGRSRAGLWLGTIGDVARHAPSAHLDILRRDGRLAIRTLTARPVALVVAVLTLAVSLGANVAMYTVVDAVLLSPLPFRDADRLVSVREMRAGEESSTIGYQTFADLRDHTRSLSPLVAIAGSTATLTGHDRDAERVNAMRVSREYFDLLGFAPAHGRTFLESEDQPGEARRVVIISDALWQRRFGGNPGVVGSLMLISGIEFQIVGILPAGTSDLVAERLYNGAELWTPLGYDPAASFACRTCRHLRVIGRLAPGASPEGADAELDQAFAALEREHPASYNQAGGAVVPLTDMFLGPVRPVLVTLSAGVALLLLIACGNVAHLLLLRASERQQEIAVRTALGVSRSRLVRQFLTESFLLAGAGGLAGLAVAWLAVRTVATQGPSQIPRLATLSIDGSTLAAATAITLLSGLVFGLVPLRHVLRSARAAGLRSGARGTDAGSTWRARTILVGSNVALAAVLLVGSGLLVRSLTALLAVDPGFRTENLLTFELWASGERFRSGAPPDQIATAVQYYDDVLSRMAALPGVTGAAATTTLPLGGNFDRSGFHIEGRPAPNPQAAPNADRFAVTPTFFAVMDIALDRGRLLDATDRQQTERVAVINATAARTLFGGDDPIGRRISLGPPTAPPRTIVGIVRDVAHPNLDDGIGPQVYVPQAQWAWAETAMTVVVRTTRDPLTVMAAARDVVRSVDRLQPVTNVRTMEAIVAAGTGMRRFAAILLAAFAASSVLLAVVGLYGSVSLMVSQRRREIGVRLAVGASAGGIRRLVVSQGLRPVIAGLVAGLALAAAGVPLLQSMLYALDPLDPVTFGLAALVLTVVAFAACLGPARRAGRIDPATAVRD